MNKKLPTLCPSCEAQLKVKEMHCESCGTTVSGSFDLPGLSNLSAEDQKFILAFVKSSGRLKEMASQMKLSYPTVRNILDELIEKIKIIENHGNDVP